jgi:hypothetical protein
MQLKPSLNQMKAKRFYLEIEFALQTFGTASFTPITSIIQQLHMDLIIGKKN